METSNPYIEEKKALIKAIDKCKDYNERLGLRSRLDVIEGRIREYNIAIIRGGKPKVYVDSEVTPIETTTTPPIDVKVLKNEGAATVSSTENQETADLTNMETKKKEHHNKGKRHYPELDIIAMEIFELLKTKNLEKPKMKTTVSRVYGLVSAVQE